LNYTRIYRICLAANPICFNNISIILTKHPVVNNFFI